MTPPINEFSIALKENRNKTHPVICPASTAGVTSDCHSTQNYHLPDDFLYTYSTHSVKQVGLHHKVFYLFSTCIVLV